MMITEPVYWPFLILIATAIVAAWNHGFFFRGWLDRKRNGCDKKTNKNGE